MWHLIKGHQEMTVETGFPGRWDRQVFKEFKAFKVLTDLLGPKVSKGHREWQDHKGLLVSRGFKVSKHLFDTIAMYLYHLYTITKGEMGQTAKMGEMESKVKMEETAKTEDQARQVKRIDLVETF